MEFKDISRIKDFCLKRFNELPGGLQFESGEALGETDRLAVAYYRGTVDLLIFKGLLKNDSVLDFKFIEPDSNPPEDDFL